MPNRMEIDIRTIQIWIELNSREQGKRGKATMRVTLIDYATMACVLMSVAFSPAVLWIIVLTVDR